jgi:hypothetical protein
MLRCALPKLLLATVACLLPLLAPGESHLANKEPRAAAEQSVASARVRFKVVIPEGPPWTLVGEGRVEVAVGTQRAG